MKQFKFAFFVFVIFLLLFITVSCSLKSNKISVETIDQKENKESIITKEDAIDYLKDHSGWSHDSKDSPSPPVEYIFKHLPVTEGGKLEPVVKLDLNNGYHFYYFEDDELSGGSSSDILYGETIFNHEFASIFGVEKFLYNDEYIFAISAGTPVFEKVYVIIDSKRKSYIVNGGDKNEFYAKLDELYGKTNREWVLSDGTQEGKGTV